MDGKLEPTLKDSGWLQRGPQALVALAAGMSLVPLLIFGVALLMVPPEAVALGNAKFWSVIGAGSTFGALLSIRIGHGSLLRAAALGFSMALFSLLVVAAWLTATDAV